MTRIDLRIDNNITKCEKSEIGKFAFKFGCPPSYTTVVRLCRQCMSSIANKNSRIFHTSFFFLQIYDLKVSSSGLDTCIV